MKVRIRTVNELMLAIVDLVDCHLYREYEFVPKISPSKQIRTRDVTIGSIGTNLYPNQYEFVPNSVRIRTQHTILRIRT